MSRKVISVFGSSSPLPGSADYEAARRVGRLLAEAGFAVQTGGYGGVMAGASQGAAEASGHVIGITSVRIEGFRADGANQWVKEETKYETLYERQTHLVGRCEGAIVLAGGIGTLAEFSLMWSLVQVGEISPRPIVAVGGLWQRTLAAYMDEAYIRPVHQQLITIVSTVDEAAQKIIERIK